MTDPVPTLLAVAHWSLRATSACLLAAMVTGIVWVRLHIRRLGIPMKAAFFASGEWCLYFFTALAFLGVIGLLSSLGIVVAAWVFR